MTNYPHDAADRVLAFLQAIIDGQDSATALVTVYGHPLAQARVAAKLDVQAMRDAGRPLDGGPAND